MTTENIIQKRYSDIQQSNMKKYFIEVLKNRAVLNPVDGLKPVHRRILWALYSNKWNSSKQHVKSAKIVGAVIGEYHPHSDTSVYDAMAKLAQKWYTNYPLVDPHGEK